MGKKRKRTKKAGGHERGDGSSPARYKVRLQDGRFIYLEVKNWRRTLNQYTKGRLIDDSGTHTLVTALTEDFRNDSGSWSEPPKRALRILSVLLKGDEREAVLGDLNERYQRQHKQVGRAKANCWMYFQVARSLLPFVLRLSGKIGWLILGEWIKKLIS